MAEKGCGATSGLEVSKEAAIAAWNTRADQFAIEKLTAERDRLKGAIDWLRKESVMLGNLLSVIHRDGGHYVRGFGVAQACIDAETIVSGAIVQSESIDALIKQAVLAEREACAGVCEQSSFGIEISVWHEATKRGISEIIARECAKAIRARSIGWER